MPVAASRRALGRAALMSQLVSSVMAATTTASAASSSSTVTMAPPEAAPADIAGVVNPSFAGFGIEPSNLFAFTGDEDTNDLSMNLLANLANYTGEFWKI